MSLNFIHLGLFQSQHGVQCVIGSQYLLNEWSNEWPNNSSLKNSSFTVKTEAVCFSQKPSTRAHSYSLSLFPILKNKEKCFFSHNTCHTHALFFLLWSDGGGLQTPLECRTSITFTASVVSLSLEETMSEQNVLRPRQDRRRGRGKEEPALHHQASGPPLELEEQNHSSPQELSACLPFPS